MPKSSAFWNKERFSLDLSSVWQALGLTPAQAIYFFKHGVNILHVKAIHERLNVSYDNIFKMIDFV